MRRRLAMVGSSCFLRLQETAEPAQKSLMPLVRNGADHAMEAPRGQGRQEAEPDDGGRLEPTLGKVGLGWFDQLIQALDTLTKLRTYAAN
jgi:hypothetical protein